MKMIPQKNFYGVVVKVEQIKLLREHISEWTIEDDFRNKKERKKEDNFQNKKKDNFQNKKKEW